MAAGDTSAKQKMYRGEITEKAMPAAPISWESPADSDECTAPVPWSWKKKTRCLRYLYRGLEQTTRGLRYMYRGPEKTTRGPRYMYRGPEKTTRGLRYMYCGPEKKRGAYGTCPVGSNRPEIAAGEVATGWREPSGWQEVQYAGGEATARAG